MSTDTSIRIIENGDGSITYVRADVLHAQVAAQHAADRAAEVTREAESQHHCDEHEECNEHCIYERGIATDVP